EKLLSKRRIKFLTGTRVENMEVKEGGVTVSVVTAAGEARTVEAEKALIAVGRKPNSEGIGLERVRLSTAKGFIPVDQRMQTGVPGIYAIGDVVPTQQLAHLASHEGILAMRTIAGEEPPPLNYDLVPNCTYCSPEVASVGLTERAARERGYEVV